MQFYRQVLCRVQSFPYSEVNIFLIQKETRALVSNPYTILACTLATKCVTVLQMQVSSFFLIFFDVLADNIVY